MAFVITSVALETIGRSPIFRRPAFLDSMKSSDTEKMSMTAKCPFSLKGLKSWQERGAYVYVIRTQSRPGRSPLEGRDGHKEEKRRNLKSKNGDRNGEESTSDRSSDTRGGSTGLRRYTSRSRALRDSRAGRGRSDGDVGVDGHRVAGESDVDRRRKGGGSDFPDSERNRGLLEGSRIRREAQPWRTC